MRFGITKTNENAKHSTLEKIFVAHLKNIAALEAKDHSSINAVRGFTLSQNSVFYRVYVTQWWQKLFEFADYCRFRLFRAFLSIDPSDPDLIKLVDQTLLRLQFGPMHPPITEVIFVRARILDLRLTNWEVYTAFHSKACIRTETGITIKAQPRWLKPLNVFPQHFLLICAYISCLITFLGLLFASGDSMNTLTSIVSIVTALASVVCFRLGSGWETGERVLTHIYGAYSSDVAQSI